MDPQLDARLQTIEAKIESIESTVKKIRKVQRTTNSARFVYWMFIILLGLGAFYFVQPYLTQLKGMYQFVGGSDTQYLNELLKQLQMPDN